MPIPDTSRAHDKELGPTQMLAHSRVSRGEVASVSKCVLLHNSIEPELAKAALTCA